MSRSNFLLGFFVAAMFSLGLQAQLSQIMLGGLLPDQQTLDFTAGTPGPITGMDPLFTAFGVADVQLIGTWNPTGDLLSQCVTGNALCAVGGVMSIVAPGGPLDAPSPSPTGFGFTLQNKVTQAGFLPVDECCWSMDVEIYDTGILLDTLPIPDVGNCVPMIFESVVPFDEVRFISAAFGGWGLDDLVLAGFVGPSCQIVTPMSGAAVSGVVPVSFDVDHALGLPVDVSFDFSLDSGATYAPCTAGGALTNPTLGVAVPASLVFDWDSLADGAGTTMPQTAIFRVTVSDGTDMSTCEVDPMVDNAPTCVLVHTNPPVVMDTATFDVTPDSVTAMTVDASFEYSLDGGAIFAVATPTALSSNPLLGIGIGVASAFEWDSRADGVGLAALAVGVLVRASVDDGTGTASCLSAPFDVDNTALCGGLCGDCNENGMTAEITDALTAAQLAAGLFAPMGSQAFCCDVNASGTVEVTDALVIAQDAAGLPVALVCP